MNLTIDWGNSSLKIGWFDGGALRHHRTVATVDELRAYLAPQPPTAVIVSSTSRPGDQLREQLPIPADTRFLTLTGATPVPLQKAYETPQTLGADRVAAAVGATVLFPAEACLVIDMGTCITYDLVDETAVFRGGMISPGFRMRFRAMHSFTERLPLVEPGEQQPPLLGQNTRQAMQGGVINGLQAELNGIIDAHRRINQGIKVIVCGGDAPFFESSLKPPIFAVPELVLIGLNRILEYNVDFS